MSIIGLDIGYGVTKVVRSDGVKTFKSIVGIGKPNTLGLSISDDNSYIVQIDNSVYTVGDWAKRFRLPLLSVRKRNFIESTAYKALILAALGNNTGKNKIFTGLPVNFMNDTERLIKVYKDIDQNIDITVIPQPAGTFFDILLDAQGQVKRPDIANAIVGVIDIGTYTTDILMFDRMDPVKELSGTITIGIHNLLDNIIDACSDKRRNLTHTEIETALTTGYITRFGQKISISNKICHYKSVVAKDIWSYTISIWGGEEGIDFIVLTGGGAPLFKDYFPQFPNFIYAPNTYLSNAYGFYKLGKRI